MAFALGVPNTLYQYWVNWPPGAATLKEEAIIRAWGPIFSVIAGLAFWLVYRKRSQTAAGLPLLYLSALGVTMFFGSLMSAAFVGDFSGASRWLELPMAAGRSFRLRWIDGSIFIAALLVVRIMALGVHLMP